MKKIVIFLCIIIFVPVVVIGGVLGFLKFADLNKYKPQIENMVQKYAQIKIKINGDLDVGVSLKPSLEMNDVSVYNPKNEQEKLAQVGNALVRISVLPLLHKEIVVDTIETSDTAIYYGEKDVFLIKNLTAGMDSYASPINISFETNVANIDINGNSSFSSLQSLQQNNFDKTDIDFNVTAMGYLLSYKGALNGLTDKINTVGSYEFSYKISTVYGDISADLAPEIPEIKMNTSAKVINISDFTETKHADSGWFVSKAFAADYIPNTDIPYDYLKMANVDVDFDFKEINVDSHIKAENVKGNILVKNGVFKTNITNADVKGFNINGVVSLDSPKSLPYIKLNVKGDTLNVEDYISAAQQNKHAAIDWIIPNAQASTLMKNTQIPYQYLKIANADVGMNIKNIKINKDVSVSDFLADLTVKNGVFKANIKSLKAGNGNVSGNFGINAGSQTASADLTGKDIILQQLDKSFSNLNNPYLQVKEGGKNNVLVRLTTSGKDTNQYLSNMNGEIIILTDKSIVNIKSLDNLRGNILVQILENLKLNVVGSDLNLSCMVARTDIKNGVMNFPKGLVFDSSDFYLVADGKISLRDEKINLDIQPFSGKIKDTSISSILGGLLKIKGTISSPNLAINKTSTAKNVIAAVATAGMYNVGDLMLSADQAPCHTALIGTPYADYFKADNSVRGNVSKGYTNTKDSVTDIGNGLKKQVKGIKNQLKGLFK